MWISENDSPGGVLQQLRLEDRECHRVQLSREAKRESQWLKSVEQGFAQSPQPTEADSPASNAGSVSDHVQ